MTIDDRWLTIQTLHGRIESSIQCWALTERGYDTADQRSARRERRGETGERGVEERDPDGMTPNGMGWDRTTGDDTKDSCSGRITAGPRRACSKIWLLVAQERCRGSSIGQRRPADASASPPLTPSVGFRWAMGDGQQAVVLWPLLLPPASSPFPYSNWALPLGSLIPRPCSLRQRKKVTRRTTCSAVYKYPSPTPRSPLPSLLPSTISALLTIPIIPLEPHLTSHLKP